MFFLKQRVCKHYHHNANKAQKKLLKYVQDVLSMMRQFKIICVFM